MRFVLLLVLPLALACGDDDTPEDSSTDPVGEPEADVVEDEGMPDLGTQCEPACEGGFRCCPGPDGEGVCVDRNTDPLNCGLCGRACEAEGRGTTCEFGECICGNTSPGCLGERGSLCCPPRASGGASYCANLETSSQDCGGCDMQCDPAAADRCDSGVCRCGDGVGVCEGTPESTCCPLLGEISCVNTTSDRVHCGGCNVRCQGAETCMNSLCTVGETACDSCGEGEICCGGACCGRLQCVDGACMEGT